MVFAGSDTFGKRTAMQISIWVAALFLRPAATA